VYVKYYGMPNSYWMPATPNLTLGKTGILVFEADLGATGWLISDASWKARKADAWSEDWRNDNEDPVGGGVPIEVFDARRLPHDWRDAGFDDSDWGAAQAVLAGCGRVQRWCGPIRENHPGDVVSIAPGEKHWHGAAPTTAMTHLPIVEKSDRNSTEWMEHVSDEQYLDEL
jgi:hypothetical protein